jgi:D-glycero-D-manno-heptose 1,7-bisphosphate phosphatase
MPHFSILVGRRNLRIYFVLECDVKEIRDILLDRDGTVIENRHYLADPDGVALLPGAGEAMARLAQAGKRLFLVTNQSGIGRGYHSVEDFNACQERLATLLEVYGVRITDVAFCPHGPEDGCSCRKPASGMWEQLRDRHGLDPEACVMVGDSVVDVGFGLESRLAATALVHTGHGVNSAGTLGLPHLLDTLQHFPKKKPDWPHVQARDLAAVVDWLLRLA